MKELWNIYHHDIPEFIKEYAATKEMQRLKDVGMNCGCEYTHLKIFTTRYYYSRYEHSIGVALIIWHFTKDIKQSIAGLLHDIATPVFAHAIDFLNQDYIHQESTEDNTDKIIENSIEIMSLLNKYHLTIDDVKDYHMYPVADNDSPQLSADRLEYTLGNLYNYGYCELEEIERFYQDLIVDVNEYGIEEIQFKTKDIAYQFIQKAFFTFEIYVADSDRFSMQCLADIVRYAVNHQIFSKNDLYSVESEIIQRIENDKECRKLWHQYKNYSQVVISKEKPSHGYYINVNAKRRYIDPLVNNQRVSIVFKEINEMIKEFLKRDFNYWVGAK